MQELGSSSAAVVGGLAWGHARQLQGGGTAAGWHAVSSRRPGSVGPASDVVGDVPEGGGTSFGAWVGMDGTMVVPSGAGVTTSDTGDVGVPRAVGAESHGQVAHRP